MRDRKFLVATSLVILVAICFLAFGPFRVHEATEVCYHSPDGTICERPQPGEYMSYRLAGNYLTIDHHGNHMDRSVVVPSSKFVRAIESP